MNSIKLQPFMKKNSENYVHTREEGDLIFRI